MKPSRIILLLTIISFYAKAQQNPPHVSGKDYYGQLLQPNSTLKMFFIESMAEFISIKAKEAKYGKTYTVGYINERRKMMNDKHIVPLPQVTNLYDIDDAYRYNYAPLLLAMEKRFGENKVKQFCREALNNTQQLTDYNYFLKLVRLAGINDKDWKVSEEQVIDQKDCKNVYNYL